MLNERFVASFDKKARAENIRSGPPEDKLHSNKLSATASGLRPDLRKSFQLQHLNVICVILFSL